MDRLKRVCFHLCEDVFSSVCGRGAAFRSVECMFRPVECRFYGSGCMFQPVERSVCRRRAARSFVGTVAQVARSQAAAGGCSTCDSGRTGGWALKIYKIYKLWVSFKKNN